MKEYVLNYYPLFKCVAGECKHTCCAGWQMNIDQQSLNAYNNEKSAFGEVLRKGINFKRSSFKADKMGRCIFLDRNGLCEIIKNLGEQSLCQVCRDHPRFRAFFDDRVELGLGFCCEEACKIILTFKNKIYPVLVSDDEESAELDFNQKNVLTFRQKVIDIIQDRNEDINDRIAQILLLCNARIEEKDASKIIKTFFFFERLNKSWTARLKSLKKTQIAKSTDAKLEVYAEQFLVNSLFRHLYDAEDTLEVRARTIACVIGWWIINGVFERENRQDKDDLSLIIDVVREYSAEIEYSQKNLTKLYSLAYNFIKI